MARQLQSEMDSSLSLWAAYQVTLPNWKLSFIPKTHHVHSSHGPCKCFAICLNHVPAPAHKQLLFLFPVSSRHHFLGDAILTLWPESGFSTKYCYRATLIHNAHLYLWLFSNLYAALIHACLPCQPTVPGGQEVGLFQDNNGFPAFSTVLGLYQQTSVNEYLDHVLITATGFSP